MKKTMIWATSVAMMATAMFVSCGQKGNADQPVDDSTEIISDGHNSQNSLEWWGSYVGTTPCADCEGINVHITLNSDETYEVTYTYLGKAGKPDVTLGKFTWDETGSVIKLDAKTLPPYYKVGENQLFQLDMEGNPIDGEHADMYILHKAPECETK